ncbi:MAG: DNA-3-methyladenine glycosylase 2 family protein [Candidatus Nanopelagicaceae bacterium]|nr:DNA-3-methyladenine glycosylase 2 family protein [Candidatus Nanopelagicaceae bacterium]
MTRGFLKNSTASLRFMSQTLPSARKIASHIIQINPKFEVVIERAGFCTIGAKADGRSVEGVTKSKKAKVSNFASLASSILSQQLSTKAAATIIGRVEEICGGTLQPKKLAGVSIARLRAAGCSNSKARAVRELAKASVTNQIPMKNLHRLSDQEIMEYLLPMYGIGKWTVEMFMMFQLERVDVWPVGDLGVRRGWERIHRMRSEITPETLLKLGASYSPYRSHVAWYCWRANEVLPNKD